MRQKEMWDGDAAQRHGTPGTGMFAPDVLGPTVARLPNRLRVSARIRHRNRSGSDPLAEHGIRLTGVELSRPMIEQLRTKVDEATIEVVVGDMATARAPVEYSIMYLVFNTISNLLTQRRTGRLPS